VFSNPCKLSIAQPPICIRPAHFSTPYEHFLMPSAGTGVSAGAAMTGRLPPCRPHSVWQSGLVSFAAAGFLSRRRAVTGAKEDAPQAHYPPLRVAPDTTDTALGPRWSLFSCEYPGSAISGMYVWLQLHVRKNPPVTPCSRCEHSRQGYTGRRWASYEA